MNQIFRKEISDHIERVCKGKVTGKELIECRYHDGIKFCMFLVTVDNPEEPDWWLICGGPGINLIPKKWYPTKDEAFELNFEWADDVRQGAYENLFSPIARVIQFGRKLMRAIF